MITHEELLIKVKYYPENGSFLSRAATPGRQKWSKLGTLHPKGYIYINLNHRIYKAHRLAWLYVYGYFPEHGIDHEDRIRHHNWIANLREVTQVCNLRNIGNSKATVSGV